jgi:hypothetical protein
MAGSRFNNVAGVKKKHNRTTHEVVVGSREVRDNFVTQGHIALLPPFHGFLNKDEFCPSPLPRTISK